MNDADLEGSHINAEAGPSTSSDHVSSTPTAAAAETGGAGEDGEGSSAGNAAQEKGRVRKKQRLVFLNHLIRNLDVIFYCELSVLFYMDCSLLKFLIRAIPHWFYFTPKPDIFPPPPDIHRPYIGTILSTNLFCMFLHAVFNPPVAGEATHGYLHGGMLIDFVGQASPVSKMRLLSLDVLSLMLQILIMTVTVEKQGLTGANRASQNTDSLVSMLDGLRNQAIGQNHDLEERGVLASAETVDGAGIELSDMRSQRQGRTGGEEDGERDELGGNKPYEVERDEHPLDIFYTGEYIVLRIPVLDHMRVQWQTRGLVSNSANQASTASGIRGAGSALSRRMTFGFGGRPLDV